MSYPKILHCLPNTKASFAALFMPCFNLWMRCNVVILGEFCKQLTLQQRGREIISVHHMAKLNGGTEVSSWRCNIYTSNYHFGL